MSLVGDITFKAAELRSALAHPRAGKISPRRSPWKDPCTKTTGGFCSKPGSPIARYSMSTPVPSAACRLSASMTSCRALWRADAGGHEAMTLPTSRVFDGGTATWKAAAAPCPALWKALAAPSPETRRRRTCKKMPAIFLHKKKGAKKASSFPPTGLSGQWRTEWRVQGAAVAP